MSAVTPPPPVLQTPGTTQGSVGPATPGTLPQNPTLAAMVVNPPAALARMTAGTLLDGQVVTRDMAAAQAVIKTAYGTIMLKLAHPPAEGTRLTIALQQPGQGADQRPALVRIEPRSSPSAAPATISNPAASLLRLPPGTIVEGRASASDHRGHVTVQTSHGALDLRTLAVIPTGARVALQIQANQAGLSGILPATVSVLSAPAATASPNPAATVALAGGATAVPVNMTALPPSAALAPGMILEGRVIAADGRGSVTIQTAQGPLTMQAPTMLPVGSGLVLQVASGGTGQALLLSVDGKPAAALLGTPAPSGPPPGSPPIPPALALAREWPALRESIDAIRQGEPQGTGLRSVDTALPRPGPQLGHALALAIGALRTGELKVLFGEEPSQSLARLGRSDLVSRLTEEFSQLSRLANAADGSDWRAYLLPFHDGQQVQQIQMFSRRHARSGSDRDAPEVTARFLFDIELSRLGRVQLDGLAGAERFDLMIRSQTPLSPEMRADISLLFAAAREEGGFKGEVGFQTVAEFPVEPLEELVPEPADHGIVV